MTSQEFVEKYSGRRVRIEWRGEILDGIVSDKTMASYDHTINAPSTYVCINDFDGRLFVRMPQDIVLIDDAPLPLPG